MPTAGERLPPDLYQLLCDPRLGISVRLRAGIAVGVIFLMTVKPGLHTALLAIGIAAVLGLASGLPDLDRGRAREERAS